ncbi:MAG TPA: 30S ribosomal protein S17 [Armatimonadota bacterium]|nr:30S ribosomal protein S17 [Armatimonadota bacterium]
MEQPTRGVRKQREGVVVSDKMDKTVIVAVETVGPHRLYRRVVRHSKRFMAHDEDNRCKVGDRVRLSETRPLSHRKRWRVSAIIEVAK